MSMSLNPRETDLVTLLAQGHTDATTAAALGISERTVSSLVRSLMDRLGVENRFQLGVALGALGITPSLPAPDEGDELPEC